VHKEDNKHDGLTPKTVDRFLTGRHRQSCKNNTQAVLPVHAMKAYNWCRGTDPLILYLDIKWGGCLDALAALLPPWKEPRCPLNRRLRELQSRSGLLQNRNISYACPPIKVVSCEPGAGDSGKTRLADRYQQRQELLVHAGQEIYDQLSIYESIWLRRDSIEES